MKKLPRWILYAALVALYLLHNDFWFWNTPQLVLGVPVGLLYHITFCVVVTLLMALFVNRAWLKQIEVKE
jgi:hypothetical protein